MATKTRSLYGVLHTILGCNRNEVVHLHPYSCVAGMVLNDAEKCKTEMMDAIYRFFGSHYVIDTFVKSPPSPSFDDTRHGLDRFLRSVKLLVIAEQLRDGFTAQIRYVRVPIIVHARDHEFNDVAAVVEVCHSREQPRSTCTAADEIFANPHTSAHVFLVHGSCVIPSGRFRLGIKWKNDPLSKAHCPYVVGMAYFVFVC